MSKKTSKTKKIKSSKTPRRVRLSLMEIQEKLGLFRLGTQPIPIKNNPRKPKGYV